MKHDSRTQDIYPKYLHRNKKVLRTTGSSIRGRRRKQKFDEEDAFLATTLARIEDSLEDGYEVVDASSESSCEDDHLNNRATTTTRSSRGGRRKYELDESDALIAVSLARIDDNVEYDEVADYSSESSFDDDHLNLHIPGVKPYEIMSFLNNERENGHKEAKIKRSRSLLKGEKSSNFRLMLLCFTLLFIGTALSYSHNHKDRSHSGRGNQKDVIVHNSVEINDADDEHQVESLNSAVKNNETDNKTESELLEISNTETESIENNNLYVNPKNKSVTIEDPINQNKPVSFYDEKIIKAFRAFSSWKTPFTPEKDVPVYWHIPRTGGTTTKYIISHCLSLVETNAIGIHEEDDVLRVVTIEGGSYVNVDTTTQAGITRAREMNLTQSGLVDIIITPYLHDIATLFDDDAPDSNKTMKCFTMLRHPIDRAVSMFHTLQDAAKQQSPSSSLSAFQDMSIVEYANSNFSEENWMVRYLTNEMVNPLSWSHLRLAMKILGNKCIVGLFDQFEESIQRFDQYFGWDRIEPVQNRTACQEYLIDNWITTTPDDAELVEKGTEAWNLLEVRNAYDIILYEYATKLFARQKSVFP